MKLAELRGHFLCLLIDIRFCTPVLKVNASATYQVEDNGKGRTVFIFCS
nr:MAG TPA: hypothetical protein [Caudoviricetes sp.]